MFNTITSVSTILVAFILSNVIGQSTISVTFAVEGCTSNCLIIENEVGNVKLMGFDKEWAYGGQLISEEAFRATEVPFTVDIPVPENPASLIEPPSGGATDPVYYVQFVWDSDKNLYSNCAGDIQVIGSEFTLSNWNPASTVDIYSTETQTVYIEQIEQESSCEGLIQIEFTKEGCSGDCMLSSCAEECKIGDSKYFEAVWGKLSLYGYPENVADVSATLIAQQDFYPVRLPFTVDISYPENTASLIKHLTDEKEAKYYVSMERCQVDIDYDKKWPNVELVFGDEAIANAEKQILYVKETDEECAACDRKVFVKVLLCLLFIFYIFV